MPSNRRRVGKPHDLPSHIEAATRRLREARPDLTTQAAIAFLAVIVNPGDNLTNTRRVSGLSWWVFNHEVRWMTRGTPEKPALLVRVDGRRDRRFVHVYPTAAGIALAAEAVGAAQRNNINSNNDTKGEHE